MADDYVIKARIVVDDSQARQSLSALIGKADGLDARMSRIGWRATKSLSGAFKSLSGSGGVGALERVVKKTETSFNRLGSTAARELSSIDGRAESTGMSLAGLLGGAAVIGGAVWGLNRVGSSVVGIHTEVQNAEGSIATLSSALFKMPIDESLGLARSVVQGLNEDAAKGVGELGNYTKAFQMLLAPTSAAGANLEDIRAFTRQSLTAGFAMRGVAGLEQAPLDIVQALQQGVNERMTPIAARVVEAAGESSKAFNKMDVASKMKVLQKGFDLFEDGAKLLGQGWDAQTATMTDQLKQIARTVTRPLFERWTEHLRNANAWLEKNQDRLISMATEGGGKLVAVWDHLIQKAGTYAAILAGISMAQQVPSSLGGPGGSRAGAPGGDLAAQLAKGAYSPAVSAGADLFGKRGGVVTAGTFAPMAPIKNLVSILTKAAGPALLLSGAFMAIQGALAEFPSISAQFAADGAAVMESVSMISAAFSGLTSEGSALNLVGYAILRQFMGIGTAFSYLIRGAALVIESINLISNVFGTMVRQFVPSIKMMAALMTGDMAGGAAAAAEFRAAKAAGAEQQAAISGRIARILGKGAGEAAGAAAGDAAGGLTPAGGGELPAVPDGGNTYIGKVEVDARSTINDDPARVAMAWETILDEVNRNPRQSKRQASPLIG